MNLIKPIEKDRYSSSTVAPLLIGSDIRPATRSTRPASATRLQSCTCEAPILRLEPGVIPEHAQREVGSLCAAHPSAARANRTPPAPYGYPCRRRPSQVVKQADSAWTSFPPSEVETLPSFDPQCTSIPGKSDFQASLSQQKEDLFHDAGHLEPPSSPIKASWSTLQ